MKQNTLNTLVSEIRNDTPLNKANFLVAAAITGVLLLAWFQQEQAKPIQIKNAEQATYTMTLINPPIPGHNEE